MKKNATVHVLGMNIDVFGTQVNINPVLIVDDAEATLVDAGYPGYFAKLKEAVENTGIPFCKISRVIITHQDWDHIGSLPDIRQACGAGTLILSHEAEKPYIEGTIGNIKMTPERIASRLAALPESMRDKASALFANLPTAKVDHTVHDNEVLPFHGGIRIIHTPGHTPGHICLYLPGERQLIAGDQLRVENGNLVGPAAIHTVDMPTALDSLKKLTAYDIDRVICYHGGVFGPNASARISQLASLPNA